MIRKVGSFNNLLEQIPTAEKCLSLALMDIKVRHRKFKPSIMIENYLTQLIKLTRSLQVYRQRNSYPAQWSTGLSKYEIVVESDAGPLMLSPTGQFIAPASCPAALLIDFLDEHLHDASSLLEHYEGHKQTETNFIHRCLEELQLQSIEKDDNVTPDLMIICIEKLLSRKNQLKQLLKDRHVRVSKYYAVLESGQICIPWNWVL
jgi:hypothetical protein